MGAGCPAAALEAAAAPSAWPGVAVAPAPSATLPLFPEILAGF